jgi:hypothetical protein
MRARLDFDENVSPHHDMFLPLLLPQQYLGVF